MTITTTSTTPPAFTNLTLAALVLFAALTPSALLLAPALAAQLGGELGIGPADIGTYFFVENGAFSFASLLSVLWLRRINTRLVAWIAAGVFAIGNFMTAVLLPDFSTLLVLRAITGLGGGSLMVLSMVSAQAGDNPDRVFGFWMTGQVLLGAIGLALLPMLFANFGLSEFYLILGGVALLISPLVRGFCLPAADDAPVKGNRINGRFILTIVTALGALLLYYIAVGAAWTFASSTAEAASLTLEKIGPILAAATLLGILGSGLATLLGGRISRKLSLTIGYAILSGSLALLSIETALMFIVAICVFKFAWTFALPFIIAEISSCDSSGRLVASTTLIIGMGLSLGPLIAGNMLEGGQSLSTVMLFAAVCSATSFVVLLITPKAQSDVPASE